ncbi:hypothetical protein [Mesonia maritima]|uniref:Lipoprotein n=1 Tax=Mesonia maritima TaxID=1793873 RepID=A0ABU1K7J4_9FLAO|nr:hypothetical protein [Mesonia maritima]MDR6301240.1 hypothetical protein [Mesonia maritima]
MKSKSLLLLCCLSLFIFSCKNKSTPSSEAEEKTPQKENILQKVANAHGIENWSKIKELQYTFNVDRDSSHYERSWKWQPKENKVEMLSSTDTVSYTRTTMDSLATKADQAFINDKYWLLFPYQLVWDEGFSHSVKKDISAPISQQKLAEITIEYNNEKGYTPGDTYKIYVDKNYIIQEWAFYPKGKNEPALVSTWEDYQTLNGLKIAKMHKNESGSFKLYFSNLEIQ